MPFCGKFGLQFFRTSHFPQCEIQSIWKGLYESEKREREVRKGGRNLSWFFVINRCSFTCVWGYTKNGDWKTSHMKGEQYCVCEKSRTESGLSEKNGRDRACSTINDAVTILAIVSQKQTRVFFATELISWDWKEKNSVEQWPKCRFPPCHGLDKRSVTL